MLIKVKITPNASRNQIVGWIADSLKIKICKAPEKGKANKELINFLSHEWDIPKNCIIIKKGFKNRNKVLLINTDKKIKLPPKPQRLL